MSSNGGIRLDVKNMALGSGLNMDATTSNGLVTIGLPSAFEGTYDLTTSNSNGPIVDVPTREDPWGKGRPRTHEQRRRGSGVSGRVHWGHSTDRSSLTVRTSNAPVTLNL